MYEELKKLSQATLDGIRGADTNAGTGNAIVNDFARSSFRDVISGATNVGAAAAATAQAEEEAAKAARAAEIQKIQDKLDPNKYTVRRKEDGGFDFLDPEGKNIDIKKYSQITGLPIAKILSTSDNPFDQQYVNDYNNTKDLITAIQNGDTDTVNGYMRNNQAIGSMKPEDLMRELIRKYPHIYGNGRYGDSYTKSNNNPLLRYNSALQSGAGASGTGISASSYGY